MDITFYIFNLCFSRFKPAMGGLSKGSNSSSTNESGNALKPFVSEEYGLVLVSIKGDHCLLILLYNNFTVELLTVGGTRFVPTQSPQTTTGSKN